MNGEKYIPMFESLTDRSMFKKSMILRPDHWWELTAFRKLSEAGQFRELSEDEYNSLDITYEDAPSRNGTIKMPYNKANYEALETSKE